MTQTRTQTHEAPHIFRATWNYTTTLIIHAKAISSVRCVQYIDKEKEIFEDLSLAFIT